ncbi:zinc transporter ZIP4 [Polymixia lowei]
MGSSLSLLRLLLLIGGLCSFDPVFCSAGGEDAYRDVLGIVSPGQEYLTEESVRSLFNILEKRVQCGEVSCEKCNLTESIHQLIGNHSIHGEGAEGEESKTDDEGGRGRDVNVSISEFSTLAAGCIFYLSSPALACTAITKGRWGEETERFLDRITHHEHHEESGPHQDHEHANELHHEESGSHQDHEDTHGHTPTHEEGHQHEHIDVHGVEALLQELKDRYQPLNHERCVTADDIMVEVDTSSAGGGQSEEVGAVLGRVLYHALQGRCFLRHSLPEESFFMDYIMERMGSENFTVSDLEALMRSLNLGPEDDHGHEHGDEDEHTDHDHSGRRLRKRSSRQHQEGHGRNNTWDQRCFSAEDLVLIHGLLDNSSAASGMDRNSLARLSPALLQQSLSQACSVIAEKRDPDGLSQTERYIYATIANIVITLTSMFGIVVLLCTSCSSVFQLCIQFCISLAVGSLTGDALLHLVPMFLGLHVHSDNAEESSHHNHDHETPDYIYKMLVVLAGIYYFYLMETIFSLVTQQDNHHHHPHHHGEESEPHHCDHGKVLEMFQQERKQKHKQQSTSQADLVVIEDKEKSFPEPKDRTREQRLLPYMITLGDGIHNFADGLAMGAAFSLSWKSGLATSLAVLCHELPHELGDFAILLHCGVSVRKALLLNVGSAMTSFVGLYIALSVATDLATKQWIAAITAGLFLYVGLADMLPAMIHFKSKRPWLMFLLQNVGLLSGWAILLVLSLFEDQIGF